ncbi:MAG: transglutaminase-like cysteine peptidase [Gammaproteobacteria bacterium]|nr:transglutaminase-like cysteine peptidase [Gammaproteobacteria bacterium]
MSSQNHLQPRSSRLGIRRGGALAIGLLLLMTEGGALAQLSQLSDETIRSFTTTYGRAATRRLMDWQNVMQTHVASPEELKRKAANDYFNQIPWLTDDEHWGQADYWATPLEMIGTNGGDCEDYSISKYFTLLELQVPGEKLLITYVRAPALKQTHMVLAYYPTPDADPLILDNYNQTIMRGSQRTDLIPVYSFNGDGLWLAVQRSLGRRVSDSSTLAQWRGLLERMEKEGLIEKQPG